MDLFSNSDLERIAESLAVKTLGKELKWEDSPESGEYKTRTGKFTYYIKARDEDDLPPYRFQIYGITLNTTGKLFELVTSADDASLAHRMGRLYSLAKLNALGIDSLKNDVLKDLGLE